MALHRLPQRVSVETNHVAAEQIFLIAGKIRMMSDHSLRTMLGKGLELIKTNYRNGRWFCLDTELALSCDFTYCDTRANSDPEINLGSGFQAGGITTFEYYKGKAMEMVLTGEMIGSEEALGLDWQTML